MTEQPASDKFTIAQVVQALQNSAGINAGAAAQLKCSGSTIARYRAAYPEIETAVAEIEEDTLDLAETQLVKKLQDGSLAAILYYLSTKGKARGWVKRYESTGPDGKPLQVQPVAPVGLDLSKFTTEELEQFEALCAKASVVADGAA